MGRQAPPVRHGAANNRYNGGLCFHGGRWIICCRDGTTIHYARAVMWAELGRPLTSAEIVHHVNGDTADDRPENLRVVTRAEHIRLHRADLQRSKTADTYRRGGRHPLARLTDEQAAEARIMLAEDWPQVAVARQFDVSKTVINGLAKGRTYA